MVMFVFQQYAEAAIWDLCLRDWTNEQFPTPQDLNSKWRQIRGYGGNGGTEGQSDFPVVTRTEIQISDAILR